MNLFVYKLYFMWSYNGHRAISFVFLSDEFTIFYSVSEQRHSIPHIFKFVEHNLAQLLRTRHIKVVGFQGFQLLLD